MGCKRGSLDKINAYRNDIGGNGNMVYVPGEWTEEELKKMFDFAPEEQKSSDPDVLYSGEMIDVGNGGVKNNRLREASPIFADSSVIDPMFYQIAKNPPNEKLLRKNKNSRKVSEKSRAGILAELTGAEERNTSRGLKKKKVEVI